MSSRPLSPHLQIYRPQLTTMLSITHRGTGIFLSLGALVLTYWLVAVAGGAETYDAARECLSSGAARVLLGLWTFSFYYHLCNGVRHLAWDVGAGFELTTLYRSGYAVIAVSAAMTIATWAYALSQGGAA